MCQEESPVPMSSLLPRGVAGGQPVLHAEDDPQHLHGYPCDYILNRTCQQRLFAWKPKRSSRFEIAVLVLDPVACQETPCRCSTGMVLYSVRSSIQGLFGGRQWTHRSGQPGHTQGPQGLTDSTKSLSRTKMVANKPRSAHHTLPVDRAYIFSSKRVCIHVFYRLNNTGLNIRDGDLVLAD